MRCGHGVCAHAAGRAWPHVDWSEGAVELLTEAREWVSDGRPRRAGISSFGISGTNAHVILEEAPVQDGQREAAARAVVPFLSTNDGALRAQADRLAEHVAAREELSPLDVAFSLATTRSVFEHRAVVVGRDREELTSGLAEGGSRWDAVQGRGCVLRAGRQRCGMGIVYDAGSLCPRAVTRCVGLGLPLREVIVEGRVLDVRVHAARLPSAHEVALVRLESWGVAPTVRDSGAN
ncbi:ketoacyl-synthetase C-terminal extension domain-containing protein [Streptomyces sp. DHE17-7]|uniref:ketoacyl-synthetase C-terminal extension domain-containing protein n=1 Tax=Streptomyces sp. DHE17-7 TaxID=2759949 RepID=UPI003FA6F178